MQHTCALLKLRIIVFGVFRGHILHITSTAHNHKHTHKISPLTHSTLQCLSAHGRHQRGDGARVKAGETESQAAVHTVGGELEGLLTNVQLLLEHRVGLLLVQVLHHSVYNIMHSRVC